MKLNIAAENEISIALREIHELINRKIGILNKTTNPRVKFAIQAEIKILYRFIDITTQTISNQETAYTDLYKSEGLMADVCAIHGINLPYWAKQHPLSIKQRAAEAIKLRQFTIPEIFLPYIKILNQ